MVDGKVQNIHQGIDSRLQPIYCIAHRLIELVYPSSARSPPERIADIGTEYSKVYAVLFIGHLVLTVFESRTSRSQQGTKLTLIVVRRIVATPKTAGAGVALEASFPMFTRPMATSSERIARLRFFELSVMVERQGSYKAAVLGKGRAEDPEHR